MKAPIFAQKCTFADSGGGNRATKYPSPPPARTTLKVAVNQKVRDTFLASGAASIASAATKIHRCLTRARRPSLEETLMPQRLVPFRASSASAVLHIRIGL